MRRIIGRLVAAVTRVSAASRFGFVAGGSVVAAAAVGVVIVLTAGGARGVTTMSAIAPGGGPTATRPAPTPTLTPSAGPTTAPTTGAPAGGSGGGLQVGPDPAPGSGQFAYAGTAGPVLGSTGAVTYFQIAVESGLSMSVGEFTDWVDTTLGDPRSWVHDDRRFEHVAGNAGAAFTIYLASPWTAYQLCLPTVDILIGGVPYTSCQNGSRVVINSARFLGTPGAFTGSMTDYRRYVINHEVGHKLGKQHVGCPGAGQLAPVMQQQTLFMSGCLPNSWPHPEVPAPVTPSSTTPSSPPPTTATPSDSPTPTDSPTASPSDDPTETETPT